MLKYISSLQVFVIRMYQNDIKKYYQIIFIHILYQVGKNSDEIKITNGQQYG